MVTNPTGNGKAAGQRMADGGGLWMFEASFVPITPPPEQVRKK
jgi:hypothetical protein